MCVCVYGAGVSIKHGELTTMTINRIAILASRLFRSFVRSLVSSLVRCLFDDGHSHSSTFFPIRLGVCVYVWVHMNGNIWPFFLLLLFCYYFFLVDEGQSKTTNKQWTLFLFTGFSLVQQQKITTNCKPQFYFFFPINIIIIE